MTKAVYVAILGFSFCCAGSALAEPIPDIMINGSDDPVAAAVGTAVDVSIALDPQEAEGVAGDWWLFASTPLGPAYYNTRGGRQGWNLGINTSAQGPLRSVGPIGVRPFPILAEGEHHLFFAVDLVRNGVADNLMFMDEVVVDGIAGEGSDSTGLWNGAWAGDTGVAGEISLLLYQSGTDLSGTGSWTASPCVEEGTASGTIDGEQVDFIVQFDGLQFGVYHGTLTPDHTAMSGNYEIDGGECDGETGTWELSKQ
jgi:hypothetical protein